ncbi:MAG TPA: SDR family oxidoreductase [Polyangiales bacterium]|nr:SDR family oxidoreductase [Polyangiales bacterium]
MTDIFSDLQGKSALITGASTGLGRHFASLLAARGVRVAIGARRRASLEEAARAIGQAGGQALPLELDVTDAASVRAAVGAAQERFGGIDILINNAGVSVNGPAIEQSPEDWDRVLDTNLKGAFLMSTEVARQLRERKRPGSIVNIASVLAFRQASHVAAYAASKAGLVQLTKELALELARHQIRVNALAPGYILTDLNRHFFESDPGQQLIRRIPQRRLGNVEDLDAPLLLLASDASRFMTGSVIAVDGGYMVGSLG